LGIAKDASRLDNDIYFEFSPRKFHWVFDLQDRDLFAVYSDIIFTGVHCAVEAPIDRVILTEIRSLLWSLRSHIDRHDGDLGVLLDDPKERARGAPEAV